MGGDEVVEEGGVVPAVANDKNFGRIAYGLLSHLGIAAVGDIAGGVGSDDGVAFAVKAHSVELAGGAGDQHGVDAIFGEFGGNLFQVIHR